jgi:fucose 4-O-acetylase-like acetyltransferase
LRDDFEDYARAIGIILVVYGHVLRGLASAGIVPAGHWILSTDYAIYTFHMPLFFVLSGLHVERSLRRGRVGFLRKKIETIVYPYLLWSLLQGAVQWMASADTNHPFAPADFIRVFWDPWGQFWFLYALFLCQVFVCVTSTRRTLLIGAAVIAYVAGSILDFGMLTLGLKFFLFFATGILLGSVELRNLAARFSTWPRIAATFVLLLVAIHIARPLGDYNGIAALPATALGVLLVCELSYVMERHSEFGPLRALGVASMPIYLAHILAGSGARIALMHFHLDNMYLQIAAGVLSGLLVPLAMYHVAARMRIEKLVGFPKSGAPTHRGGGGHGPAGALN